MSRRDELPEDATPLRKISAAVLWEDEALIKEYVAEARAARIPEHLIDFALGNHFDLEHWQEALATLNPEERSLGTQRMKEALHRPRRDRP